MASQDAFRQEVEDFLVRHDMAAATLGVQALKDPKFVSDLRRGRSPSLKTIDRVRAWMSVYDQAHPVEGDEAASEEAKADAAPSLPESPATTSGRPGTGKSGGQKSDHAAPPVKPAPRRAKGWRRLIRAAVILAVLGGAGLAGWPWLAPRLAPLLAGLSSPASPEEGDEATRVAALEARVAALDARLAETRRELEAEVSGVKADMVAQVEDLAARLEALERAAPPGGLRAERGIEDLMTRLAQLESTVAALQAASGPGEREALAALGDRIDAVKARLDDVGRRLETVARAFAAEAAMRRLRQRTEAGRPFTPELAALTSRLAGGGAGLSPDLRAALDDLRALSETGVAPLTRLLAEAPTLDDLIAGADEQEAASPPATGGWWARTRARLASLVRVRRIDNPDARLAARLAAIRTALANHAVDAALAEFDTIDVPLGPTLAAWRADIEAHARAQRALGILDAALDGRAVPTAMSASPPPGPPGE